VELDISFDEKVSTQTTRRWLLIKWGGSKITHLFQHTAARRRLRF